MIAKMAVYLIVVLAPLTLLTNITSTHLLGHDHGYERTRLKDRRAKDGPIPVSPAPVGEP